MVAAAGCLSRIAAAAMKRTHGTGLSEDATCPSRHCWISVPVDGSVPRPALLLGWRRVEKGRFEGLVVYQASLRPGRWATITEWVPAELLSPADSTLTR
jgi:hypothetical protein